MVMKYDFLEGLVRLFVGFREKGVILGFHVGWDSSGVAVPAPARCRRRRRGLSFFLLLLGDHLLLLWRLWRLRRQDRLGLSADLDPSRFEDRDRPFESVH